MSQWISVIKPFSILRSTKTKESRTVLKRIAHTKPTGENLSMAENTTCYAHIDWLLINRKNVPEITHSLGTFGPKVNWLSKIYLQMGREIEKNRRTFSKFVGCVRQSDGFHIDCIPWIFAPGGTGGQNLGHPKSVILLFLLCLPLLKTLGLEVKVRVTRISWLNEFAWSRAGLSLWTHALPSIHTCKWPIWPGEVQLGFLQIIRPYT